jgi:tryptophanyl-tRNA synthetase
MGWGHAKQELFERMNEELKPYRTRYEELMADKDLILNILHAGGEKARPLAEQKLKLLRRIIGIN